MSDPEDRAAQGRALYVLIPNLQWQPTSMPESRAIGLMAGESVLRVVRYSRFQAGGSSAILVLGRLLLLDLDRQTPHKKNCARCNSSGHKGRPAVDRPGSTLVLQRPGESLS